VRRHPWLVIAAIGSLGGCAVTMPVRTVPAGETRLALSAGEPLASHLISGLVPYVTVGAIHGITDATTVGADLHASPAAVGVFGADISAAHRLVAERGHSPELTAAGQVAFFVGSGVARLFPSLLLTSSWSAGPRTLLYGSLTLTGQFTAAPVALLSPSVGISHQVTHRLGVELEWRWFGANVDTHSGLFEGAASLAGHGAMSVNGGIAWRW
jgi:hypothetical protein